ncbi:MAG TPA: PD-(D/E)XK nuclease family protein, partial [Thermoanaerobaculia bacterium]|nr:PD-(D/E)XK nuclease family protein [Thermoanaerobaculia bacterium]
DLETTENKALGKAADPFGNGRPVGYFSGAIDLLYRDPEEGSLVVADFKTDQVEEGGEADTALERRAAAYAPQGRVYARAVAAGFGLADLPRFELWFLRAGRIVEVDLTGEETAVQSPLAEPAQESAGPFGERAEETDEGAEESAEPKSAEPEPRAGAGGQFKLFE